MKVQVIGVFKKGECIMEIQIKNPENAPAVISELVRNDFMIKTAMVPLADLLDLSDEGENEDEE